MASGIDTLDELLSDPIVQLVMARDSVQPDQLRHQLEQARFRARWPTLPPANVIEAHLNVPVRGYNAVHSAKNVGGETKIERATHVIE